MDNFVDYTAYTAPVVANNRRFHSSSNENVAAGYAKLLASGNTSSDSQWVVVYSEGARSFYVAQSTKRFTVKPELNAETSRKTLAIARLKESIEFVYCNDEASLIDETKSRVALRGVVDAVEDLADNHEFMALDEMLAIVEPKRLRPVTAVAFLRSSFAVKERLSNWNGLYQVVYAHLSDIGENPKRTMRGLSSTIVRTYS